MAKKTKIIKKPGERDITPNALTDYMLPKPPHVSQNPPEQPASTPLPEEQPGVEQPVVEQSPGDSVSGDEPQFDVDRRKGERRQVEQRRAGLRGYWEERRVLDRRKRDYSIFGKRLDGADDKSVPNNPDSPDVPLELLISPSEIRILEEQEQLEQEREGEQEAAKPASEDRKRRKSI